MMYCCRHMYIRHMYIHKKKKRKLRYDISDTHSSRLLKSIWFWIVYMVSCCVELLCWVAGSRIGHVVFCWNRNQKKKEKFHKTTNSKYFVVPRRDTCTWKFANMPFIGCWQPFKPWQEHKFQNNYFRENSQNSCCFL